MPSDYLLRLNQRANANVVVQGGSEDERVEAVRALHDTSPLRDRPFHVAHGTRDHDDLVRALMHWLGQGDGPAPIECDGGMLYVDDPGALPAFAQRMLIDHSERMQDLRDRGSDSPPEPRETGARSGPLLRGPARLAAGSARDLHHDVACGRLLPALHDALDIFHLRIGIPRRARGR